MKTKFNPFSDVSLPKIGLGKEMGILAISLALWLMASANSAKATSLTWAPSGSGTDGSGTWETSNAWYTGLATSSWVAGDSAVFGDGSTSLYTVNLGSAESAAGLIFQSGSNYTLSGSAITLTGTGTGSSSAIDVTGTNTTATLDNLLATTGTSGTYTFTVGSGDTLTLAGGGAFAGTSTWSFAAGSGTVDITGGTYGGLTIATGAEVGITANGTFNQSGTSIIDANRLNLGTTAASTYTLSSGTFNATFQNGAGQHFFVGNGAEGTLTISGGTMNVDTNNFASGEFLIATNQASSGSSVGVTSGTLTIDPDAVLVINDSNSGTSGSTATASMSISGGTVTAPTIYFGDPTSANAFGAGSSGTLTLSGTGTLYVGAGGIVDGTNAPLTVAVNLNGGTLGATAAWSSSLAMGLGGAVTIQAANASATAENITLNGVLSGTGSLTKTGAGMLLLSNANTYTGATAVNAGTLSVTGSLANTAVTVASGATLTGTGTIGGLTTVSSGGILAAGTSAGTTLTLNNGLTMASGSTLTFALSSGNESHLALAGAVSLSSGMQVDLLNIQAGTYTDLISGLTIDPTTESSWTLTTDDSGYSAVFSYSGGDISAVVTAVVPEPSTWALLICSLGVMMLVRRLRLREVVQNI